MKKDSALGRKAQSGLETESKRGGENSEEGLQMGVWGGGCLTNQRYRTPCASASRRAGPRAAWH